MVEYGHQQTRPLQRFDSFSLDLFMALAKQTLWKPPHISLQAGFHIPPEPFLFKEIHMKGDFTTGLLIGACGLTLASVVLAIVVDIYYPRRVSSIKTTSTNDAVEFFNNCTLNQNQSAVIKKTNTRDGLQYKITCFKGHGDINE